MVYALFALAVLCVAAGCGGRKTVAASDLGITVPDADGMTEKEVANAILRAGADSRWVITPLADGLMTGVLEYRGYVIPVDITYDARSYKIHYTGVDKDNVDPRVNKWMRNLDAGIRKELLRRSRT